MNHLNQSQRQPSCLRINMEDRAHLETADIMKIDHFLMNLSEENLVNTPKIHPFSSNFSLILVRFEQITKL